jgi:hypothetical protein
MSIKIEIYKATDGYSCVYEIDGKNGIEYGMTAKRALDSFFVLTTTFRGANLLKSVEVISSGSGYVPYGYTDDHY